MMHIDYQPVLSILLKFLLKFNSRRKLHDSFQHIEVRTNPLYFSKKFTMKQFKINLILTKFSYKHIINI